MLQPGLDLHEDNDENEEKRNTEIDVPCVNPATSIADVLDQNVWIAVAFEDTWYPGLVDSIEPDGLLVNFMHPCLLEKNKFQWPKKVDTMKVEKKFVLFVCLPPTRFQRGEKFYFEGYELILKLYLDFKKNIFLNKCIDQIKILANLFNCNIVYMCMHFRNPSILFVKTS